MRLPGRIAWFDAKARKVTGDAASFDHQLGIMQKDLLFYTWMHERYGCDGGPGHGWHRHLFRRP